MSFLRYVEGAFLTMVCGVPLALAARRLRARWLPAWSGSPAWVAEAVLFVGLLILILQALGIAGLFTLPAVVVVCPLVGGAIAWRVRSDARGEPLPAVRAPSRVEVVCAILAVGVVAAPWLGWTVFAYRHGMQTPDTVWYHLPQAARFVQLGTIRHLQYFDSDPITGFYPANAELPHALGMLLFGRDIISPLINLLWGALAVGAAWALGRRIGRPAHAVVALAVLLGTPLLVDTQPGGAYNDIACIALVLAAAAVLAAGGLAPGPLAVAAVACGIALGIKFTMLVIPIALGVLVVALPARMPRVRRAGVWAGGLIVFGGFWYVRNWVSTGTPLPALPLGLGRFVALPHVHEVAFSVARNLASTHVWSAYYLPGLHTALGLAWWAIGGLAAVGLIGAVGQRGAVVRRALGAIGLIGVLAYLFTPQFLGFPTAPIFFVYNLRYVVVPVALGLVLAPTLLRGSSERVATGALGVGLLALAVTALGQGVWPTGLGGAPFATPISSGPAIIGAVLAVAGTAIALGLYLRGGRIVLRVPWGARRRRTPEAAWLLASAVVTLAGWPVVASYARVRYADTNPVPRIFAWARHVHHARIGVAGIVAQYPLTGVDESNYVQYVGVPGPNGGFANAATCRQWRVAVNRGRYDWLVLAPPSFPLSNTPAPELPWTERALTARIVMRERAAAGPPGDEAVLVRITGPLAPSGCPGA